MAVLGAKQYDPSVAVTASTASLLAMTALDTTNLRITFTCPASGNVWVRMSCCVHGATTFPQILLGVLDGATVRGRATPLGAMQAGAAATQRLSQEASFIVGGLTPGNSYTWDASYAVQTVVASTGIKYGGPNNTTTNDAFGAFTFEVWEATNLLGFVMYDPATAVAKSTASLIQMTAIDTTNARITFTAPSSGNVLWRLRTSLMGATTFPSVLLGILESSSVVARKSPVGGILGTALATTAVPLEGGGVITGVSAGSHSYDAAYGVEILLASTNINYGGPNNNSGANAWGGLCFELWQA